MLEIKNNKNGLVVTDNNKSEIKLNTESLDVVLDGFDVTYPGEYEKSGILLEVKEF